MIGPKPRGHWSSTAGGPTYEFLQRDRRFRVVREFRDFDGHLHAVGEEWTFRCYSFLPHDDGLSLIVSLEGDAEWHIRMQCVPGEQGDIVENLASYLVAVDAG